VSAAGVSAGGASAPPVHAPALNRVPRRLHPGAWWLWALGLAAAASRTTDPLLLGLVVAVVAYVVARRRGEAPWARGLRAYVVLGVVIIVVRVAFRALLDGQHGAHVLVTLPELPLPDVVAGIRVGGPVSLEGLLAAAYDGLRLATVLLCVGAANVLADPRRLLKALPGAVHELGVAITVALTLAPQVVDSAVRVNQARKLRGTAGAGRWRVVHRVALPVVADALDRSLHLAASMDGRGFGRVGGASRGERALTGVLVLGGLVAVCAGTYGVLDGGAPAALGLPTLAAGLALAGGGLLVGGRRVRRTSYRPDPWRGAEWAVAASGLVAAAAVLAWAAVDPSSLHPSLAPLRWPAAPPVAVVGILVGIMPAWLAPPPGEIAAAGAGGAVGGPS
jgi:energy-coupling factor transport system permease protein